MLVKSQNDELVGKDIYLNEFINKCDLSEIHELEKDPNEITL